MFGDCQVMSSMGGSGISSDSLFSSPIRNPNFDFMASLPFNAFAPVIPEENGVMRSGKEEMESGGSGSELHLDEKSVNEIQEGGDPQLPNAKKKRYHRHTARQIQEMEALFKECPHPDDKQRMRLSQELGLKPRQVKFWFQNRRTQMKAQQDRAENVMLRAENENLKNENYRLQAALRNVICPNCGGPAMLGEMGFDEQQLRIDNARLKEELERVCCIASRYGGPQVQAMLTGGAPSLLPPSLDLDMNIYSSRQNFPQDPSMVTTCSELMPTIPILATDGQPPAANVPEGGGSLVLVEEEKYGLALDLALSSMDELVKMCHLTEPLWLRSGDKYGATKEVLDYEEHARFFPYHYSKLCSAEFGIKEASRDSAVIIMNSITLVDAFLDANKWMELFPSIVSRAKTIQVIASGISGHASGSLHLMYAELQVLSPLVPTRETYFLRNCQQNVEEGTWAIVDFPIDSFHENLPPSFPRYRRRPSGCVIQDMPNGYSRVTWVEHGEIEEKPVHPIFGQFVCTEMAFGAQRWLAVLQRQCERVASLMARNISDLGVIPSPEARRNLMRLSQRMIRTFCINISTSGGQSWTAISDSGDDTVRVTTRKITEPGQPNGVVLAAVSSTWLPYPHYQVFDLLKDERRRSQLDVLSNGNSLHEVAHIANGSHPGNCISLLRINVASNSSQHVELMLQESCTDHSGSLVVYSTIDVDSVQLAMNGEDPSCIPLLPIGFSIVPAVCPGPTSGKDGSVPPPPEGGDSPISGCLLTVGLQVLASTVPTAKLNLSSITAINTHICNTVHQISSALCNGSLNCPTDHVGPLVGLCSELSGSPGK
ncbi:homeobox-leucine zipper protein HDG5-like isoform X2 [Punica granatum]|uniref:Homeobox-leucine zipper protein HDG5-like isoform X2 n=1 Tax=Punica granatum TaxID=22663 RepID=A0A6P8C1D6_PUNGR|nr:homeobox-leucine zipper protein HDG5-like isoform X2 [Punica granatum]